MLASCAFETLMNEEYWKMIFESSSHCTPFVYPHEPIRKLKAKSPGYSLHGMWIDDIQNL